MTEAFLHFVWQQGHFDPRNLKTSVGLNLQILQRGILNTNSGPDFGESAILVDNAQWYGFVEIHILASDWIAHKHHTDPAYNAVILHVVWENDAEVHRLDGSVIPCLELKKLVPPGIFEHYQQLRENLNDIPCKTNLNNVNNEEKNATLKVALNRNFEEKAGRILNLAAETANNWQAVFYTLLCKYLGFKINAPAMETLAKITPFNLLAKHSSEPLQVEALLFGQAGFLNGKFQKTYPKQLQKEYSYLQHKYQLSPMPLVSWKFMRMRPANFPTMRIAQLAALVLNGGYQFQQLINCNSVIQLKNILHCEPNDFWLNHYHFQSETIAKKSAQMGDMALNGIIINAVVPVLHAYGKYLGNMELQNKALRFLQETEPEKNVVVARYEPLGFLNNNAAQSQSILGLHKYFCSVKKCLDCSIGMRIILG
jgi:hypothetical protein